MNREQITTAWEKIRPHVHRTPVMETRAFGHHLCFKLEHMQHTGSFKARGALNSLLSMDVPPAGLVAASGGNHGAAVAWAAAGVRSDGALLAGGNGAVPLRRPARPALRPGLSSGVLGERLQIR